MLRAPPPQKKINSPGLDPTKYMRRLTTGIRSEKSVVRRFRHCANVLDCTYTNLDSTDTRRLTTGIRSEKSVVRAISSLCERHTVYLHKPRQYSIAYCTPRLYGIAYCC